MNDVYPICCSVDVHKKFFVATIITIDVIQTKYKKRRFSTFNHQILAFKKWLLGNNCYDVCMESTGKYWIPMFNLLKDFINVTIANPKWVKTIKGKKVIPKIQNGLATCSKSGLYLAVLSPARIFVYYANTHIIVLNLFRKQARKTSVAVCNFVFLKSFLQ